MSYNKSLVTLDKRTRQVTSNNNLVHVTFHFLMGKRNLFWKGNKKHTLFSKHEYCYRERAECKWFLRRKFPQGRIFMTCEKLFSVYSI